MQLDSLGQRDSWNPLTFLISLEAASEGNDLYTLPIIHFRCAHQYSRLFHEMTHLWSARTTRFGYYLGREAALLWLHWKQNPDATIQLPPAANSIVGAFLPLLEGLALFAELDFEAEQNDVILPNPLTQICELFEFRHRPPGMAMLDVFRLVRDLRRSFETCKSSEGTETRQIPLPEVLFLDQSNQRRSYYFAGYLYIKAIQSLYARRCPIFQDSTFFLPLINRLIADHPVWEQALAKSFEPQALIEILHQSLLGVSAEELRIIADKAGKDEAFRSTFDNWDCYAPDRATRPTYHDFATMMRFYPIDQDGEPTEKQHAEFVDQVLHLRSAASVHLVEWQTGSVEGVRQNLLHLRTKRGVVGIHLIDPVDLLKDDLEAEQDDEKWNRKAKLLGRYREQYRSLISTLESKPPNQLTIATFVTATLGTAGYAVWLADRFSFLLPLSLNSIWEGNEIDTINNGLKIGPSERLRFREQLADHSDLGRIATDSARLLLERLVSDEDHRYWLMRSRFHRTFLPFLETLQEWCRFRPAQPPVSMPDDLLELAGKVFDFPGFPDAPDCPSFADLLPRFT